MEKFVLDAVAHGKALEDGRFREANRLHRRLSSMWEKMWSDGTAIQELTPLLGHDNPSVAIWAAALLLRKGCTDAERVLRQISKEPGIIGLRAETALMVWKDEYNRAQHDQNGREG